MNNQTMIPDQQAVTKVGLKNLLAWLLVFAFVFTFFWFSPSKSKDALLGNVSVAELGVQSVTPPVYWGDLGKRMTEAGVIDRGRFEALYANRGGLSEYETQLLVGVNSDQLVMDQKNAGILLNLLWALGLSNENIILEKGPMTDPRYGGAGGFASTGGWTLAKGDPMQYYSRYNLISLTPAEQALVEGVAKNVYRPCCDNSTYFPDCNHGMAMLGLLELMASQGVNEEEMYRVALQVNSFWFPSSYETIAEFLEQNNIPWSEVDPRIVLGREYSSGTGFGRVRSLVASPGGVGGGSCGV